MKPTTDKLISLLLQHLCAVHQRQQTKQQQQNPKWQHKWKQNFLHEEILIERSQPYVMECFDFYFLVFLLLAIFLLRLKKTTTTTTRVKQLLFDHIDWQRLAKTLNGKCSKKEVKKFKRHMLDLLCNKQKKESLWIEEEITPKTQKKNKRSLLLAKDDLEEGVNGEKNFITQSIQ